MRNGVRPGVGRRAVHCRRVLTGQADLEDPIMVDAQLAAAVAMHSIESDLAELEPDFNPFPGGGMPVSLARSRENANPSPANAQEAYIGDSRQRTDQR